MGNPAPISVGAEREYHGRVYRLVLVSNPCAVCAARHKGDNLAPPIPADDILRRAGSPGGDICASHALCCGVWPDSVFVDVDDVPVLAMKGYLL